MRIRTYLLNSFIVHSVFLIYLFSLPLHRTIIQPGLYNAYFVSLQSEGKKTANTPSAPGSKKPEVQRKVEHKETRPETREHIATKVNEHPEEAKEATPVEKPDEKTIEQVDEEKPVAEVKAPEEFQQVKETQQEMPALEEKKQETPKNELPESNRAEKTIAMKETEKRLEPQEKEVLKEKAAPDEAKETAKPQEIEKPMPEIPEGEKPDVKESEKIEAPQNIEAKVPDAAKSPLIEKPPTEERVSSPEVEKTAGPQTIEKISKAEPSLEQNKVMHAADEKGMSETIAKGKPKIKHERSPRTRPIKNRASAQGLKEESSGKVLGEPAIQGSTIEQTASQEGPSVQGEGNEQPAIQARQEGQRNTIAEGKKSLVAMPVPEVLIPCDLKIEVALRKPGIIHSGPVIQKKPATASTAVQSNMPKATEITQISLEEVNDGIKVQIKGNGSMAPKVFTLDKNRIVIDIPNVVINSKLPSNLPPILKNVRSGKHKDKSRLVLDMDEKLPFDVLSAGDTFTVAVRKPGMKPQVDPGEQEAQGKIETTELNETEISNITVHLLKNPHPKSNQREKRTEVALLEKREAKVGEKSTVRKAFSVLRTDEGAYTFLVRNEENEPYEADLAFFIFQGKPGERTKKFAAVRLSPHTSVRFRFLLPEAIFWDDKDYFSGTIENSETMTKFNEKTGIIWKETKDQ